MTSYQSPEKRQTPISAIAWDLDNTLFDRDAAMARFLRHWLDVRFPVACESNAESLMRELLALDASGEGDRLKFCKGVLARCGQKMDRMDFMDSMDGGLFAGAEQLWREIQQKLPDFIQPEPRLLALLDRLATKVPVAIVSNGGSRFQRAKAARAGLEPWFPAKRIFISEDVGAKKPDRKIFVAALDTFGSRPESVLFVGDHPVNDIAGAASAGMQTCWISRGRVLPADLRADFVVHETWELESLPIVFTATPANA